MRMRFMMLMAAAMTCSAFSVSVVEAAFQITPTTWDTGTTNGSWIYAPTNGANAWSGAGQGSWNVDADDVETATGYSGNLYSQYKADVGTPVVEDGPAELYYDTVFANSSTDPQDATITHNGNWFIDADQTYLVVKDGNNDPGWYIFDLTFLGWTGVETLALTGFWPTEGAISHVEIFSGGTGGGPDFLTQVPEPASMALWLTMAVGGVFVARRKAKKAVC